MTDVFAESALAHDIGVALLQFLWQGAAIGAAFAIVLVALRRSSPQVRYLVACAGLALMAAAPIVTFLGERRDRAETPVATTSGTAPAPVASATSTSVATIRTTAVAPVEMPAWLESRLPLVVLLWFAGVLVLALHLVRGWMRIGLIHRHARVVDRDEWPDVVRRLADRLGIATRVRLIESALMEVPAVIGCLRPAIVVPASALAGLPPAHLEAILAHELAHIRRGDYLVNLLQSVVEVLLFYHPAVWWLSKQIRLEREHCCDDVAASLCADRVSYAEALVSLEELRGATPSLAMAATGGDLLHRVRRLVEPGSASGPTFSGRFAMCVALTVLLIAVSGHMQELPAADDRPQAAIAQPAAEPALPMATAAPKAQPTAVRPTTSNAARAAIPAPMAAPVPAPAAPAIVAAPAEPADQSSVMGVVSDSQGGVIPGATVTVTSPTSSAKNTTITNASGRFSVSAVPGTYDVTVTMVGFKTSTSRVELKAGETLDLPVRLSVGALSESITVATGNTGGGSAALREPQNPTTVNELLAAAAYYHQTQRLAEAEEMMNRAIQAVRASRASATTARRDAAAPAPAAAPAAALPGPSTPVRVGGSIREPRKIRDVKPIYPAEAEAAGVTGVVIIEAIISRDGLVTDAKVLRSIPLLNEAALAAVRQWLFTPTLLNGVPVEVAMTVTVSFLSR